MPTATQKTAPPLRKYIRVRERNQITLPMEVISGLAIHPGDFLEVGRNQDGSVYLKPTVLVTVGTPEALEQEARAEQDINKGRYETFSSAEEMMENVKSKGRRKSAEQAKEVAEDTKVASA